VVRAVVAALKQYPYLNSSVDQEIEEIILKKYYNIGVAVDTEDGLIVPVIKGADRRVYSTWRRRFRASQKSKVQTNRTWPT
jgi:pyruvate/2-oxoglutarate dehydrogenase complex dihydrolipoamide acyltransferase (E2) component